MSTPAKVSGPGKFSQRTDKGQPLRDIPNADYGEQAAYQSQQKGAPVASQQALPPKLDVTGMSFSDLFGNPSDRVVPIGEGTTMPNVPVTDGANAGPGRGMEAIGNPQDPSRQVMAAYLPALEFMANQPGSSDSARNLVRQIKYTM